MLATNTVTIAPPSSSASLYTSAPGLHHRQTSTSALRASAANNTTGSDASPLNAPLLSDAEETIDCRIKRYRWKPPTDGENVPYRPHAGEGSQYLRDFILGVNDGLISTFLLVVTTVGGGAGLVQCLLTAISAAVGGCVRYGYW